MGAYLGVVRCARCGTDGEEAAGYRLCPVCAADGVNVYPSPSYDLSAAELPGSGSGLLRYADLLPLDLTGLRSLGEGGTPVLRVERAGAAVGVEDLWVKDESRGPSWSYKDRLAFVAVNKAAQQGASTVVVSSTGNHGAAVAAYAAVLGLRCVVLTLESVPLAMKVLMQRYGASVVALREPQQRWAVMREGVEQRGWVPMSGYVGPPSGSNPFGVDGYKTIAYELLEQLGRVPDVVIAPVAYADGIAGLLRGFEDLVVLGAADRIPRIVAAEPYGAFSAALAGAPEPVVTKPTVAFSIAATRATWQGLHALERSGGTAAAAGNAETLEAQRVLGLEGLFLEPSSSIAYAVLPSLLERGAVSSDEQVVLLGTSTGLKDVPSAAAVMPEVPVIEPTLAAYDRAVGEAVAIA